MLLESFIAMYGISFFATKAIYTKLDKSKEIREEALNQGLYHITSEENCDKILKSGHIKPSNIISSLGRRKTFFFAGTPNFDALSQNVSITQYEFNAIKVKPTEEQLEQYKVRKYRDNAVIYDGQCNLDDKQVEKVKLVLDIDKNGKVFSREKGKDEDYHPSKELLEKINLSKTGRFKNSIIQVGKYLGSIATGMLEMGKDAINNVFPRKEEPKLLAEKNPEIEKSEKEKYLDSLRMPEEVIRASERAGIEYAKTKEEKEKNNDKDQIREVDLLGDVYEKN